MKTLIMQSDKNIENRIYTIRGLKVMLDKDLATLYSVTTGNLNKAVFRNRKRFPEDFMFQLTHEEFKGLIFQFGISKRGGTRHIPNAFTEQGVSMLSAVLNSEKAIEISLMIMRAFVKLRSLINSNAALRYAIEGLEHRVSKSERDIQNAIRIVEQLLEPLPVLPRKKMGFTPE